MPVRRATWSPFIRLISSFAPKWFVNGVRTRTDECVWSARRAKRDQLVELICWLDHLLDPVTSELTKSGGIFHSLRRGLETKAAVTLELKKRAKQTNTSNPGYFGCPFTSTKDKFRSVFTFAFERQRLKISRVLFAALHVRHEHLTCKHLTCFRLRCDFITTVPCADRQNSLSHRQRTRPIPVKRHRVFWNNNREI